MSEGIQGGSLHIEAPGEPARDFGLDKPVIRIGRLPEPHNDLVLANNRVSRSHARIYCDRRPYRIQDMGSSNGTMLNDQPLPPNELRSLANGDIIGIGPFHLHYLAPEPVQNESVALEEQLERLGVPARARRVPPAQPPPEKPATETGEPQGPRRWVGMPTRASRWLQYLPPIYAEDPFLARFLCIFEDMLGPIQQEIAHFDAFLDPGLAPAGFLPIIDRWLGDVVDERWPLEARRRILQEASHLLAARGTPGGLTRFLELATGGQVELQENGDGPHTLRIIVRGIRDPADRRTVERIVAFNCPAHVHCQIEIE